MYSHHRLPKRRRPFLYGGYRHRRRHPRVLFALRWRDFEGTRLNRPVADRLALTEIADALDPLFALFAGACLGNEGFGDFCHRVGPEALHQAINSSRRQTA